MLRAAASNCQLALQMLLRQATRGCCLQLCSYLALPTVSMLWQQSLSAFLAADQGGTLALMT